MNRRNLSVLKDRIEYIKRELGDENSTLINRPFYNDEVIIECRQQRRCIVIIKNHYFALNSSAKGKYKLPDVFDSGRAILGKSIGPFIRMALELGKNSNSLAICKTSSKNKNTSQS